MAERTLIDSATNEWEEVGSAQLRVNSVGVNSDVQVALNLKANLASPALTGTPTAPTPSGGANTTQIATTQFVTSAVSAVSGGVDGIFDVTEYGWLADGLDHSSEMQDVLDAIEAAGGGTMYFPPATGKYRADSQMLIPNDGDTPQPTQVNFALVGAAGGGNWYASPDHPGAPNASVLDLRYTGTGAKIVSLGLGAIRVENLNFTDGGSANGTPFFLTTNTVALIKHNSFVGTSGYTATVTISIASPGVVTWNNHGLQANDNIRFTTTGALPTGITAGEIYYVSATGLTANSFQISHNTGSASINTSGSQSGTHTGRFPGQDAIVLGGATSGIGGDIDDAFQGYGTIIDGNAFHNLNRGVLGLTFANSIIVTNNSFVHMDGGIVGIESDGTAAANAGQSNTGWVVTGNILEMTSYIYGVKFTCTQGSTLCNSFYDDTTATSYYRFESRQANPSAVLSTGNVIIGNWNSDQAVPILTQDGTTAHLTQNTLIGSDPLPPMEGKTGRASSEIAHGLIVRGQMNTSNAYPGVLTVIDSGDLNEQLSIGKGASSFDLDCYNLALAVGAPIKLNPRVGAVQTGANLRESKTTNYTVQVADSSKQFDTRGSTAAVNFTLPTDPTVTSRHGGVIYGFCNASTNSLQITAATTLATINVGGTVSVGGGNVASTVLGAYIELTNYDTGSGRTWVAKSQTGTWVVT